MDWLYLAVNALLIIWVASLQIKSSKSDDKESYDPIRIIKDSSKNVVDTVKPFVVYILLAFVSSVALYYEFISNTELTKYSVFKISLLSATLAISLASIISTWHHSQALKLILDVVRTLGDAFRGK